MENVIIKNQIKSILLAFAFLAITPSLFAQSWTHDNANTGTHEFDSEQADQNLSFYLFGDGYYSFEQKPVHIYDNSASLQLAPTHYAAAPYEDDEVEEKIMQETTEFDVSAAPPVATMENIKLTRSWNLVKHKKNYFVLSFENNAATVASGCLEFHYNDLDLDIDESEILDDYGNDWVDYVNKEVSNESGFSHKLVWEYDDLGQSEQRHVYINAKCERDAFSRVDAKAFLYKADLEGICGGQYGESYSAGLRSTVKNNPHDPNCIVAEPDALYLCDLEQTIKYKVYFHNEGVDPAQNVGINLALWAPFQNIKLIGASDNVQMEWDPSGFSNEINFGFPNIFIRGLNEDVIDFPLSETYGYVEFEVCYNLADFTEIGLDQARLNGGIVFDLEDPILVENIISRRILCLEDDIFAIIDYDGTRIELDGWEASECSEISSAAIQTWSEHEFSQDRSTDRKLDTSLEIFPNPVQGTIYIGNLDSDQNGIITILDSKGQVIDERQISSMNGKKSIQVANLPQGIYFLTVTTANDRQTKRFVKQ